MAGASAEAERSHQKLCRQRERSSGSGRAPSLSLSPRANGSVVRVARTDVFFRLRRLEELSLRAVATDDECLATDRVDALARDDGDDVHARTKRDRRLERHALRVLAV